MSLAISKCSILILLGQITPVALHRRLAAALGAFIIAWSSSSLVASAFQCSLPSAWMILGTKCFHQVCYLALDILDRLCISTDLSIGLFLDSIRCGEHTHGGSPHSPPYLHRMECTYSEEAEISRHWVLCDTVDV